MKKREYRIFPICLLLALAVCFLAACSSGKGGTQESPGASKSTSKSTSESANGSGNGVDDSGESTEAAEKKLRIGVAIYRYDDNFMKLYREELRQYLEEAYNAEVVVRNARGEQEEQISQVNEFIEAGYDGIIVNLVDTDRAGVIADSCHEAGIPLVFINREPKADEQARWKTEKMAVSCIGTDSKQAGTYQGGIILEKEKRGDFNGDGVVSYVMIMGEKDNEDSNYRTEYSIKALEDGGMKTEKLFSGHADWNKEEGRKLAEKALALYGRRIEVIFCNNDAMANGAWEAIDAAGRKTGKDIYLVGVDALEETVQYIKEGKVTGTVLNDHTGQSHTAADVLMKMIHGDEAETRYLVDYVKISTISTLQK